MDKLEENKSTVKKRAKKEFLSNIKTRFSSEKTKDDRLSLAIDLGVFVIGFLLSRCHVAFGARPLGISFIALLPIRVWPALAGVVIGGISSGIEGVVFAIAAIITTLLRIIVTVNDKDDDGNPVLFGETLLMRMAISILGGFVAAAYEVYINKMSEVSILFGLVMILLTPLLTFLLSGLCSTKISLENIILGGENLLIAKPADKNERYEKIFYQISALALIFFISLSLKPVELFGISLSNVFCGLISLVTARKFGALRALAVGFISALSLSGTLSVSYALAGLCAGVVAGFGAGYAIVAGCIALCAWSVYSSGMTGLLTTLPEYLIAAAISIPILKQKQEIKEEKTESNHNSDASDMVGTMALAYQNEYCGRLDSVESALSEISDVVAKYCKTPKMLSEEVCRDIVIGAAQKHCDGCGEVGTCAEIDIRPTIKRASEIAATLASGKKITSADINTDTEFCVKADVISEEINHEAIRREQEYIKHATDSGISEDYKMISSMISHAKAHDIGETTIDNNMTDLLTEAFESCGFHSGIIRAFGKRRRHFILAGQDENGAKISSFELRKSIESAAGVRLSTPEYFRKGEMVLMKCGIQAKIKTSFATASAQGKSDEISGDTAICFASDDDYFYSLISDGMGSGEVAKETSTFVTEFLKRALKICPIKDTLIHILNKNILSRTEECSATIDLLELDLLNGSGTFIKSGAAPSYIKRDGSIFRIRSQTAPIGLMRGVDAEKTTVELKPGDHVFMLSDGISESEEDAPWLLLLLGEPPISSLTEYADKILFEAKKHSTNRDDMSITVIRVEDKK